MSLNDKEKYLRNLRRMQHDTTYKRYAELDEYLQLFAGKPSRKY